MISPVRSCVLAVGAAALLSTQAAYAAPSMTRSAALDPLVSLAVLGTAQSRAAVCAAGANAAAAGAAFAAAQAMPPPGCLLPVTAPPPPPPVTGAVPPPPPPAPGPGFNPLLGLLGGLLLIAIAAAILSGGDDGDGDLAPISPA